jgi:hypothetical protein
MTSFKISFASDSIEGVSSLVRLSAGAGTRESVSGFRESSPPPAPGLQGSNGSAGSGLNQGETTPPPIPVLPGGSGRGDSDQGGVAPPPVPLLNGSGADSGPADSAGEVGLPPSPDQKAKVKRVTKAEPGQKNKSY